MRSVTCMAVAMALMTAGDASGKEEPNRQVTYKEIGNVVLKLHVYDPPRHSLEHKRPAIVFFFGGGWNGGSPAHFSRHSRYLADRGMVAICADYRTKGKHGTPPSTCVKDGKSALRWVRTHAAQLGIDPERIVAGGGSAGGHVAAATALTDGFDEDGEDASVSCRPKALVLFTPVFDNGPDGYGYERVKDYWEAFSPLHNIAPHAPPTLVMLGTEDKLIPVKTAETYQRRMQEAGIRCDLKLHEGQGHGFFNRDPSFTKTLREAEQFLASLGYVEADETESATD